jgi:hypothetical protein
MAPITSDLFMARHSAIAVPGVNHGISRATPSGKDAASW